MALVRPITWRNSTNPVFDYVNRRVSFGSCACLVPKLLHVVTPILTSGKGGAGETKFHGAVKEYSEGINVFTPA